MTARVYKDNKGKPIDLPVGKAICVGRNYADHIQEMRSEVPASPLLFIKPGSAIVDAHPHFAIPTHLGACHNEIELAFLVKAPIDRHTPIDFNQQIWGVGLALDLTLRDVQAQCKAKGHPWERAKAFDGSCPISGFVPVTASELDGLEFCLTVNGKRRQSGHSSNMLFSVLALLDEIRQHFSLQPGDLVLTGTPEGVGPLYPNDSIELELVSYFTVNTKVTAW